MLSKLICATVMVAGTQAHSIQTRDVPDLIYTKVNRDSEYGAPSAPSYSAPAPSYSAPAPSYSAPAPSYSAPAPSYSAPEPSYGAPSTGYGVSYEEEGGLDLTSIIIPLLALIGLSLLFPTYVSLTTVRRKRRDVGDEGMSKKPAKISIRTHFYFQHHLQQLCCCVQTTSTQHYYFKLLLHFTTHPHRAPCTANLFVV